MPTIRRLPPSSGSTVASNGVPSARRPLSVMVSPQLRATPRMMSTNSPTSSPRSFVKVRSGRPLTAVMVSPGSIPARHAGPPVCTTPTTAASARTPAAKDPAKNSTAVTRFIITPAEMMAIRCQTGLAL